MLCCDIGIVWYGVVGYGKEWCAIGMVRLLYVMWTIIDGHPPVDNIGMVGMKHLSAVVADLCDGSIDSLARFGVGNMTVCQDLC